MGNLDKMTYVQSLPEDHELLLISFFVTNPDALKRLEAQWAARDKLHRGYHGRTKKQSQAVSSTTFGGSVCLINPQELDRGILAEVDSPIATGMYFRNEDNTLYVASNKWIRKLRNGQCTGVLGNKLFNDIHSLNETIGGNLLVASTGIDGLLALEFEDLSKVLWDWLATENGYSFRPDGNIRNVDKSINYQELSTTTPEHTTHINSAINYKDRKILATLFHQGQLVEIDMGTNQTITLLDGMKCPHSIRKRQYNKYLVSDTRNNRVLLLDQDFGIESVIAGDYNWINDAIELKDRTIIVGDSNNSRVVKVDWTGKEIDSLHFESRKMYGFLVVNPSQAVSIFSLDY